MKAYLFLIMAIFFASCKNFNLDIVSIIERKVLVNNHPYQIKGICYHPVPRGSVKRSFSNLTEDLALMKEAGINTIRVYEPILEKKVLDDINAAGLKVIIGFGFNQNGNFDILSGTFIDYVNSYKNHNAILFWELGNEYNYHPEWFDGDLENWYAALNNATMLIHENDPNHPVATAHGELPDSLALAICPNIDVWGMNVYRWDNPEAIFNEWSKICSKPMYLSEAGADSYMTISNHGYQQGINETMQVDANTNILDAVFKNEDICAGVALFSFTDGLWKAGNPDDYDPGGWAPNSSGVPYDGTPNEEYWGIVDINRKKKETFHVVKEKFRATSYVLKNENLEIRIDPPLDNYHFSRFDWTGKIIDVTYKGIKVSGIEQIDKNDDKVGKGFYNEFGIDAPIAYDDTKEGDWFHKIGIGILQKDNEPYSFSKKYPIKPAKFSVTQGKNKIIINCESQLVNDYSYYLTKEIELFESGFKIKYQLQNTGKKAIETNEYTHNFLTINNELIGKNYTLKFPFEITTGLGEIVNPENKVQVGFNEITFDNMPTEQFFYSNLSGGESVDASWELINTKSNIGIRENGSFKTSKVNLWGWQHVISPELFYDVNVQAGQTVEWSRTYSFFEVNPKVMKN